MKFEFVPMEKLDEEMSNIVDAPNEKVSVPKNFKVTLKTYDKFGIDYYVWEKYPENLKVTEQTIGKKVWIAGNPRTFISYLKQILPIGHPKQKSGGYMISEKGLDYAQCYEYDSVIAHPDNFKKEVTKRKRSTKAEMLAKKEKSIKKTKK
jgi:hypothetical protein